LLSKNFCIPISNLIFVDVSYNIHIEQFDGPFDLLLFFIERDELDIYDIPISKITNDFLDYVHHLDQLDMEVASEFIFVAATLMKIKSKLMLPRTLLDEDGNEVDPREELVQHLLEYKRYKEVVKELSSLEDARLTKEKRGNIESELKHIATQNNVEHELENIDLFKLLKVYDKVIKQFEIEQSKPQHTVVKYPYTVDEQKDYILKRVQKSKVSFEDILKEAKEKIQVIFNFLAILDLLQVEKITLKIGEGYNNFWILSKS